MKYTIILIASALMVGCVMPETSEHATERWVIYKKTMNNNDPVCVYWFHSKKLGYNNYTEDSCNKYNTGDSIIHY